MMHGHTVARVVWCWLKQRQMMAKDLLGTSSQQGKHSKSGTNIGRECDLCYTVWQLGEETALLLGMGCLNELGMWSPVRQLVVSLGKSKSVGK